MAGGGGGDGVSRRRRRERGGESTRARRFAAARIRADRSAAFSTTERTNHLLPPRGLTKASFDTLAVVLSLETFRARAQYARR